MRRAPDQPDDLGLGGALREKAHHLLLEFGDNRFRI